MLNGNQKRPHKTPKRVKYVEQKWEKPHKSGKRAKYVELNSKNTT